MAQLSNVSHLARYLAFRLELTGLRTYVSSAFRHVPSPATEMEQELLIYSGSLLTVLAALGVAEGRAGKR